ncbi:hypothetical protein L195_g058497, partial [Trifolium pratense]
MNGRQHRHRHHHQPHHRDKSKLQYIKKSELVVSSPNSVVEDVEKRVTPEVVHVNGNNNVDDVASSSKTNEQDDDDGIDIMDDRLDKLLSNIQQPELSQEQIIINDQLQQDEV